MSRWDCPPIVKCKEMLADGLGFLVLRYDINPPNVRQRLGTFQTQHLPIVFGFHIEIFLGYGRGGCLISRWECPSL